MLNNPYTKAVFLKSAALVKQLPEDSGIEIAFAGRSNAGKSSALNCLTNQRQLAKTSKTPGRTQLINVFTLDTEAHRLIDLPGYGFAKVSLKIKQEWQKNLSHYLKVRNSLKGLILLMDIRHPLKELDTTLLSFALSENLPVHILLTKADKLSKSEANSTLLKVKNQYKDISKELLTVQIFSATKKIGLEELIKHLNEWFYEHPNKDLA